MMKRDIWLISVACICVVLTFSLLGCSVADKGAADKSAVDKDVKPARANFVPSPEFSPPYPPLPHNFGKTYGIQVLCQAPKGSIKRALPKPLEQGSEDDVFVLLMGWSPECEGYNVHEIAINATVRWNNKTGNTTLIEYIDSDMGLITGREVWGWPKKMADIVWTQTATGWTVTCNKLKDQNNIPLMKVEYKISNSTPGVKWPDMGPTYLVKRIPNASLSVPPLTQLVCVGCNLPPSASGSLMPPPTKETKGTATVQFFDGPRDPLTFFGPVKVLDAKMSVMEASPDGGGLGLGEVVHQWEE
jgi:acetoacetate decarboxylase